MTDTPLEPDDKPGPFREWCLVEIMGHKVYAGLVSEQVVGGAAFIRVDVPQVGTCPAFSKLFGAGSVYCLTPVSEQVARLRAAAWSWWL